jgi:hypothetical protein
VDAFGLIGQVLDKMTAGNAPSKPPLQLLGRQRNDDERGPWELAVPKRPDPYAPI